MAAVGMVAATAVVGGSADDPTTALSDLFSQLNEQTKHFDWQAEACHIEQAIDNVWRENGWTDESDLFAQGLARDVSVIPPWEFMKRLNLVSTRVAERYGLSAQQSATLQAAILRRSTGFLARNARVIMSQTAEAVKTRSNGQPFSADQIARWMQEAQPLLEDAYKTTDQLVDDLKHVVPPEKRQLLEADLNGFEKRRRVGLEMAERWTRGEWRPTDWGMQDDPIQQRSAAAAAMRAARARITSSADQIKPAVVPRWNSHDPSTWFAYVLDFQARFGLDAGQQTAAKSIHDELVLRAGDYASTRMDTLKAIGLNERSTHEAYAPIRVLFAELQARLDAIPTSSQRAEAKP